MSVLPGVNLNSSVELDRPSEARFRKKRDFPTWHFGMVNDAERNRAIESSIAALDLKGKRVAE